MADEKGFFESLMDFSFQHCMTKRCVSILIHIAPSSGPHRGNLARPQRISGLHVAGVARFATRRRGALYS